MPRDQIGYVRFVLESYEGLAQMTSLPGRCEVEWIVPVGRIAEAARLSRALGEEAGMVPVGEAGREPVA